MTITLQEGKTYLTRDGRSYGPMAKHERSGDYIWTVGDGEYLFRANGEGYNRSRDLVEEWVEPADEPCPAQIAVESRLLADPEFYGQEGLSASPPAAKADIKTEIADTAKRIVSGARRAAYGKPEDNFERIARFWQSYFENTGRADAKITAADVSPMMRLMKEARLCETPDHKDSFVDLVGYALTGAEVNNVKVDA